MSQKNYDYVVIGSGLSGLLISTTLSMRGKSVALIEAQESFGGCHKRIDTPLGSINNGLRFFPGTQEAEKALQFVEKLIGIKLFHQKVENSPITFENSQFKPFVGFGDQNVQFYEEISYFLSRDRYQLEVPFYDWMKMIFEKFNGDFLTRSFLTKFNSQENKIESVTINGSKIFHGAHFIFCGAFKDLSVLLPTDYLSSRAKSKLNKSVYWTAIGLDLCHPKLVSPAVNMHVLNGTVQDEIGPCVGVFHPVVEATVGQISQWMTFVDEELSDESEGAANALKKMKRQIKRAYPEALEGVTYERIFVYPQYAGEGTIKVNSNLTLPGIENLWIGSATLNKQKNLLGAIFQAQEILKYLIGNDIIPEVPNDLV